MYYLLYFIYKITHNNISMDTNLLHFWSFNINVDDFFIWKINVLKFNPILGSAQMYKLRGSYLLFEQGEPNRSERAGRIHSLYKSYNMGAYVIHFM